MPGPQPGYDRLQEVLEDVAAGRLLVEEAIVEVDRLRPATASLPTIVATTRGQARSMTLPLIVLLFAGSIGAVGGFFAWRTLHFELTGRTVEGKVVRMVHGGGSGNHSKPVVAYSVDGQDYEVTGLISSSPPAWRVGDRAVVHYDPADPSVAQVSGFIERWLFPVIFGGLGTVVGGIGLMLLGATRRDPSDEPMTSLRIG
jgi:hypothetical protein